MAKGKKELTLKEKHLKEIVSLRKKIAKWKDILLQDIKTNEELTELLTYIFEKDDEGYGILYEVLNNTSFKDEEDIVEDEEDVNE